MSALYVVLRGWARLGLWLFARKVTIEGAEVVSEAPTILACNHPNSFLDAILMGVFHPRPLHFLARGDAFRKPWAARLLRSIGAIPIHRLSEGREHLHLNDETFRECVSILKKRGTVLIFSEGLSEHGDGIRPLRKGTARLAYMAWHEAGLRELEVQPVRLWYHSFTDAPKRVLIRYGNPINGDEVTVVDSPAHFYTEFNDALTGRLDVLAVQNTETKTSSQGRWWLWLIAPVAVIGFLLQGWYYMLVKRFAQRKTENTVFYDSVLFGVLMLTYPLFVLVLSCVAGLLWGGWAGVVLLVLLPTSAWAMKRWRASQFRPRA